MAPQTPRLRMRWEVLVRITLSRSFAASAQRQCAAYRCCAAQPLHMKRQPVHVDVHHSAASDAVGTAIPSEERPRIRGERGRRVEATVRRSRGRRRRCWRGSGSRRGSWPGTAGGGPRRSSTACRRPGRISVVMSPRRRRVELLAVDVGQVAGDLLLLGRGEVDRRAVLGADVVALAEALGRVVDLEERLDQVGVGDRRPGRRRRARPRCGWCGPSTPPRRTGCGVVPPA